MKNHITNVSFCDIFHRADRICRCHWPCPYIDPQHVVVLECCTRMAEKWPVSVSKSLRQHPSSALWNHERLLGTPNTSKTQSLEQCHLSRQRPCPQRASWMYSWAPWELSEVSEDCAGGYMNKFPNKTRQLWPTCELQNWNQVGSRVQNAQNEHQIAVLLL